MLSGHGDARLKVPGIFKEPAHDRRQFDRLGPRAEDEEGFNQGVNLFAAAYACRPVWGGLSVTRPIYGDT